MAQCFLSLSSCQRITSCLQSIKKIILFSQWVWSSMSTTSISYVFKKHFINETVWYRECSIHKIIHFQNNLHKWNCLRKGIAEQKHLDIVECNDTKHNCDYAEKISKQFRFLDTICAFFHTIYDKRFHFRKVFRERKNEELLYLVFVFIARIWWIT